MFAAGFRTLRLGLETAAFDTRRALRCQGHGRRVPARGRVPAEGRLRPPSGRGLPPVRPARSIPVGPGGVDPGGPPLRHHPDSGLLHPDSPHPVVAKRRGGLALRPRTGPAVLQQRRLSLPEAALFLADDAKNPAHGGEPARGRQRRPRSDPEGAKSLTLAGGWFINTTDPSDNSGLRQFRASYEKARQSCWRCWARTPISTASWPSRARFASTADSRAKSTPPATSSSAGRPRSTPTSASPASWSAERFAAVSRPPAASKSFPRDR